MFNHGPAGYVCPLCKYVNKNHDEINNKDFVVYENMTTLAFVSPKWWVNNSGNVIVIPKEHVENIYDISDDLLSDVYKTAKKVAITIKKSYPSEGTSMRQHNEPAGGQDIWYFHVHVFPRYADDNLYKDDDKKEWVGKEKRMHYVNILKKYFSE
jgi:histidine triad (HIT) family protein